MKKLFWQAYYFFLDQPKLKSDAAIRFARLNGKPYNKLYLSKIREREIFERQYPDQDLPPHLRS